MIKTAIYVGLKKDCGIMDKLEKDIWKIDFASHLEPSDVIQYEKNSDKIVKNGILSSADNNIIVVDDSVASLDLLTKILLDEGYGVAAFTDGNKALMFAKQSPPDIVLLDIMMPEASGYHVCKSLKENIATQDIPVIFISAKNDILDKVKAFSLGGVDYIPKPFQIDEVLARIKTHLKIRHLQKNLEKKNKELTSTLEKLQTAQHQLIMQEKMASLGRLSAGIAHEIKNPLNLINSFASLNLERTRELAEFLEAGKSVLSLKNREEIFEVLNDLISNSKNIFEEGHRADRIIRSMLLHARDSKSQFQKENINELLKDALGLAYHAMRSKDSFFSVSIETHFDEQSPNMMVMPQALNQVFVNLINNACYALSEKQSGSTDKYLPQIIISTQNNEDHMEIRIRDNGTGIGQKHMGKIFDPFYTTKLAGEGAGLGLSICHDIICHGHGGEIEAKSEKGQFSEIIIRLPQKGGEQNEEH